MSTQHTVKQGETIVTVAASYGFPNWEPIWQHAKNAELRKLRDPQVLAEGDVVFVPDQVPIPVPVTPGRKTRLTTRALRASFRTTVIDELGKPLANCRYELTVAGETLQGLTDGSGVITQRVDPKPASGKLIVYMGAKGRKLVFNLQLGSLDPIEKLSGVKARLNNLGFDCGGVSEELDAQTKAALGNFQIVHRVPVTGEADDATRKRLVQAHDRRQTTGADSADSANAAS